MNPEQFKARYNHEPISMLTINEPEPSVAPDILSLKMPVVITSEQGHNFLIAEATMGGYSLTNLETGICLHLGNSSIGEYLYVNRFYAREAEINIVS